MTRKELKQRISNFRKLSKVYYDSNGIKTKYEYNKGKNFCDLYVLRYYKGTEIYCRTPDGDEFEYDHKGNMTYYKSCGGFKEWRQYDSNGKCIHFKNSAGVEFYKEYNSRGKLIYKKFINNSGVLFEYRYKYAKNRLLYVIKYYKGISIAYQKLNQNQFTGWIK